MIEEIACMACGGTVRSSTTLVCRATDGRDWEYGRCNDCGLHSLVSPGSDEAIASSYTRAYYGQGETKFPAGVERVRDLACRRLAHHVCGAGGSSGGRILDIGCGSGAFLKQMARRGYEIFGTELEGPACERAACIPNIRLHRGSIRKETFPHGHFDAITLWHVLEHVQEADEVLGLCVRFLKPSGRLYLEVPNMDSLQARLFGTLWLHLDPPRHVYQFSRRALDTFLGRVGLEVEARQTLAMQMGWFGFVQSALNTFVKPRNLLYELLLSRGRFRASLGGKVVSACAAVLLAPVAALFALGESLIGRGAVLRYRCRAVGR